MSKNKKLIGAVVVAAALVAIFLGIWLVNRPATSAGAKEIAVNVVHQDESTKTFTYKTDEEYLGEVLLTEGLIKGSNGLYTEVDGETASWEEDHAYWAFYIGDEYAQQGIDATPIHDGDVFSLIYTVDSSDG